MQAAAQISSPWDHMIHMCLYCRPFCFDLYFVEIRLRKLSGKEIVSRGILLAKVCFIVLALNCSNQDHYLSSFASFLEAGRSGIQVIVSWQETSYFLTRKSFTPGLFRVIILLGH